MGQGDGTRHVGSGLLNFLLNTGWPPLPDASGEERRAINVAEFVLFYAVLVGT